MTTALEANRGQRADPVAAEAQQAAADHRRPGGVVSRMSACGSSCASSEEPASAGSPSAGSVDTIRRQDIGPSASPRRAKIVAPSAVAAQPTLPMHIALVNHHVGGKAGGGGGVRLMLELGAGLVERGHRVTVACYDFLEGSEFSYAADRLEIRSVRRGPFELPADNRAAGAPLLAGHAEGRQARAATT